MTEFAAIKSLTGAGFAFTLLLIVGCGRIGFDALDSSASDAAMRVDAPDADRVDAGPFGPWSVPVRVDTLSTSGEEDDPTLTGDMLEMIFERDNDLFASRRTTTREPWPAPTLITELRSAGVESTPGLRADGLTLYFARAEEGLVQQRIYRATRADRLSPWEDEGAVTELNADGGARSPDPSPDGRTLYFTKTLTRVLHLWQASRSEPSGPFTLVAMVADINSGEGDQNPAFFEAGQTLWFSSTRAGSASEDLYSAPADVAAFSAGPATAHDALNSAAKDVDPWVDPTGHVLYFASDRGGLMDIYMATR